MKEKRQDLHQQAVSDLHELALSLHLEGMPHWKIEQTIHNTIRKKMYQKFKDKDKGPVHIKSVMQDLFTDSKWADDKGPDSGSEEVLREIFHRADIYFEFHKEIGRYTVDFFIPPDYIVECDGPHHNQPDQIKHDEIRDAWLRKKGYKIFRMTTISLFVVPTSRIIENVNEFLGRAEW